jgi:hypothetical protein
MRNSDVDLEEAADMAGCDAADLLKLAACGALRAKRERGTVYFVLEEIEELERFDSGGWSTYLAEMCRRGRAGATSSHARRNVR